MNKQGYYLARKGHGKWYLSQGAQWRSRGGGSRGTRPGAQALEAHQHTFVVI